MGKTVSSDTRPNTSLPPDKVSNMKHRTKQDRLPPVRLITFKLIALCIVSARRLSYATKVAINLSWVTKSWFQGT